MKHVNTLITLSLLSFSTFAQLDPATAPKTPVDRFSMDAGTLMVRDGSNGLPAANAPVDFDQVPFITQGLGPNGNIIEYYNFDVQSTTPAPIYVLQRMGETMPVSGQINIIDVKPGDSGYNDFWAINIVEVPVSYVANTVTSYQQIMSGGYTITPTGDIVNCPVVPEGSTASKRWMGGNAALTMGWYKDSVVFYFNFVEKALTGTMVPTSPIYVSFNINPGMSGGGPASGFKTETGSMLTHNVAATIPSDAGYSPLWDVNIYDNADFGSVTDLSSAQASNVLVPGAAMVNCPIVSFTAGGVGIEESAFLSTPNLYPNPVRGQLTVELSNSGKSEVQITVFNSVGSEVMSVREIGGKDFRKTYDLSGLQSGLYTIRFTNGTDSVTKRFVKA